MTFELTPIFNVRDDPDLNLGGVAAMTAISAYGSTFIATAGRFNDAGIDIFRVTGIGAPKPVYSLQGDEASPLEGVSALHAVEIGGRVFLFAAAEEDQTVTVFEIAEDGALTEVDAVSDSLTNELKRPRDVANAEIDGGTFAFIAGFDDDGISSFRVAADGALTFAANLRDGADASLNGVTALAVLERGEKTWLYAGSTLEGSITVISADADGAMTPMQVIRDQGMRRISSLTDLLVVTSGGVDFVVGAGFGDNGVGAFFVDPLTGMLTDAGQFGDREDTFLAGVLSLSAFEVDGVAYIAVSSAVEDGVTVLRLEPDGTLAHVASIADDGPLDGALALTDVGAMTFTPSKWGAFLHTASSVEQALTSSLFIANPQMQFGTEADDILTGTAADDDLTGGGGGDVLDGGAGSDRASYVFSDAGVHINLTTGHAQGGDAEGDVLTNIENLMGTGFQDHLVGDQGANELRGRAGRDRLQGREGDDHLLGGRQADVLIGGGGADRLHGGKGGDRFVFAAGAGVDEIVDFTIGLDFIEFSSLGIGFDQLEIVGKERGAEINYGETDLLFLRGVDANDLDLSAFIF